MAVRLVVPETQRSKLRYGTIPGVRKYQIIVKGENTILCNTVFDLQEREEDSKDSVSSNGHNSEKVNAHYKNEKMTIPFTEPSAVNSKHSV